MNRLFVYFYIKFGDLFPTHVGMRGFVLLYIEKYKAPFLEERLLSWHDDAAYQLIHLVLIIPMCKGVGAE